MKKWFNQIRKKKLTHLPNGWVFSNNDNFDWHHECHFRCDWWQVWSLLRDKWLCCWKTSFSLRRWSLTAMKKRNVFLNLAIPTAITDLTTIALLKKCEKVRSSLIQNIPRIEPRMFRATIANFGKTSLLLSHHFSGSSSFPLCKRYLVTASCSVLSSISLSNKLLRTSDCCDWNYCIVHTFIVLYKYL